MSPTCYQVSFLLFKNDLIAPKHEKKTKNKNVITYPPSQPLNCLKILKDSLKNSIILPVVSRVYQMSYKYSIKLFYVLKGVDLNNTIKKIDLITGPNLGGGGGVSRGSAKSPNFTFFFLKPSLSLYWWVLVETNSSVLLSVNTKPNKS